MTGKFVAIGFIASVLFAAGGFWIGQGSGRPAGAVFPAGGQAEMAAAIREALRSSCDQILVAASIRAADVYRRSSTAEGLSVVLRNHWAQLAVVEELYV